MLRASIISFIIFSHVFLCAQNNDVEIAVLNKKKDWDTTRYEKFDYVFIAGIYQLHRDFSNEFTQRMNSDKTGQSGHSLNAESDFNTGVVLNYDLFQISFGVRTKPRDNKAGKGFTESYNLGLNFGGNEWICENYYRTFRGFYDQSTPSFDSTFRSTGQYRLLPRMRNNLFMTRFMYFTNYDSYSYKSGFGCNYRQRKSAFTWILGGSFNVYSLRNDSSFFPVEARPLYNDYGNLKGFTSTNIAVHGGAAMTIVLFKAWFLSANFTLGPEQQWRNYNLGGTHRPISYISASGTWRLAFGLNLKRFYWINSTSRDYIAFKSKNIMDFNVNAITVNTGIGWRFHCGTPDSYGKFQRTKIYKLMGG